MESRKYRGKRVYVIGERRGDYTVHMREEFRNGKTKETDPTRREFVSVPDEGTK